MPAIEIQVGSRQIYRRALPASWKEVPEPRRLPLWQALCSAPGDAGRVAALRYLLQLPRAVFFGLDALDAARLLDGLPWLAVRPDPAPVFDSFRHRRVRYFLPSGHGLNLVALEYPIADDAFLDYVTTGKPEALRLLCATLCREEETDRKAAERRGDRRVPLRSRYEAEARAERLRDLPDYIQQAVLLYFAAVKEYVHGSYGKVLFEQPDQDENGNPVVTSTTPSLGWWSLYFSTATEGPFGNDVETLYQAPFHDVCLYLVDRIRMQKESEMRDKMASKGFGQKEPA